MANIRINDLPSEASPSASDVVAIDGAATRKTTLTALVDAGRPLANQAEAEAGTDPVKAMTPLTTAQAIAALGGTFFATTAQGATADSALQPGAIGVTVQAYNAMLSGVAGLPIVAGDILYGSGSTAIGRLAAGTDGQVLRLASGLPSWTTASGLGDLLAVNNLSDLDDADTALDNLGFGDAGKDIAALSLAADVRNYLDVAPYVADRTALKALDTAKDTVVRLVESGREGVFKWTSGDFSTHVAADTQEGIYVKATAIAATSGAWVRETPNDIWFWRWFGITHQSLAGTDMAPNINAFMAIANIVKPWWVLMGPGLFPCNSRITTPTFQLNLEGCRSGTQQSTLYKRTYTEATTGLGLLSVSTHGCYFRNIVLTAGSGSGGSLISVITPGANITGDTVIEDCNLSAGNFVDYSLYVDGSTNQSAGPGVRDMRVINTTTFGAAVAAVYARTVRSFWAVGCNMLTSGGSGSLALKIDGVVGFFSDGINISGGAIVGQIALDKCTRVLLETPTISSNVTNTSDVTRTIVAAGCHESGTLSHLWEENTCEYRLGYSYIDVVSAHLQTTVSTATGDGTVATIICDTLPSAGVFALGRSPALNYDVTTGRYTAKKSRDHLIVGRVTFGGLTASHVTGDIFIRGYTSGGSALSGTVRQSRFNPWALAVGGQTTIDICDNIYLGTGQYVEITVAVAGGAKVVTILGSSGRLTTFAAQ